MNDVVTTEQPVKSETAENAAAIDLGWIRAQVGHILDVAQRAPLFSGTGPSHDAALLLPVELTDTGDEYRLTAELPGMTPDDIAVDVTNGILQITGEKRAHATREDGNHLLRERYYGAVSRQLTLPSDIDLETSKAKFRNGVLTIKICKDAQSATRSHRIEVEK